MKQVFVLITLLFSISVSAQNTKAVFHNSPINTSNFDGEHIAYYDSQAEKESTKDAIRTFKKYHANGEIAEIGLIVNNKPEGIWKKYDENGRLLAKTKYKEGVKRGKWVIRNKDGSILAKGRYNTNGEKTGNWIYWSSNDQEYLEKSF